MDNKTIIIFIFFIFGSWNMNAQYEPIFGEENTSWNYIFLYCDEIWVESYTVSKDTVVEDVTYHYVEDYGFLRASEDNSRMWYKAKEGEEEILIMDLTLEIGDTFHINDIGHTVDSIYVENNRKVVRFDFEEGTCADPEMMVFKFIEGQGPNFDFDYITREFEYDVGLLRCHTEDDDTTIYLSEYGDDCDQIFTGINDNDIIDFKVIPNPFSYLFTLDFEHIGKKEIMIYNAIGEKVFQLDIVDNQLTVDTQYFDIGTYFIIINEGGKYKIKKIAKIK